MGTIYILTLNSKLIECFSPTFCLLSYFFFILLNDIEVIKVLHHVQVMKMNEIFALILHVFLGDRKRITACRFEIFKTKMQTKIAVKQLKTIYPWTREKKHTKKVACTPLRI